MSKNLDKVIAGSDNRKSSNMKNSFLNTVRNYKFAIAIFTTLSLAGWSSDAEAAVVYWNQAGTGGTWTSALWGTSASGPFTGAWVSSNDVIFGGSAAAVITAVSGSTLGNITVNTDTTVTAAGTLGFKTGGSTVEVATGKTLTWASQNWSAGVQNVTKSGSGTWNMGAQGTALAVGSSFTLGAGTVIVTGSNGLGGASAALNINGGNIQSTGTRAFANSAITIGGDFENSGTGTATYSGTVSLGGATRTINNTQTGKRVYSGVISGVGGGLTITGAGTGETFFGNTGNTFSGAVTIVNSKTIWNGSGAFGNTKSITLDEKVTLASDSAGTVGVTSTFAADKSIFIGAAAGIGTVGSGVTTINGVIADKLGSVGKLTKSEAGTLILGGASTYTGMTVVNNGTLKLAGGDNRLPTGSLLKLGSSGSSTVEGTTATFDLDGRSQTINGLESTVSTVIQTTKNSVTSVSAATLTIGSSSGVTTTFGSGSLNNRGEITGSLAVTKTGAGTQVLGGANTYTGTTSINAGTLAVNGSLLNTGTVLVNDTGSLSGSGSVGAVTLASGSFLKPGNSPGTLFAASSIWQAGSTYSWEIDSNASSAAAGTNWDLFSVTGVLDLSALNSNAKMNLVLNSLNSTTGLVTTSLSGFTIDSAYSWVFAQAGSINNANFTNGADVTDYFNIDTTAFNGGAQLASYFKVEVGTTGTGSSTLQTLQLMTIPEPSTGSLLGFGLAGLVVTRLLRRKQS
jgi:autotransporter-associated beta strand protein